MNTKKRLRTALLFLLAISIALSAGAFRGINDEERGNFAFQIPEKNDQIILIDLAKQGTPKYYLQPGTITLYGRGKSTLDDTTIYAVFRGVKGFLSQGSKKSTWTELTANMPLSKRKNGTIPLTIEVKIPYTQTRQYDVGKAILEFRDEQQLINSIHFHFVNSRYLK